MGFKRVIASLTFFYLAIFKTVSPIIYYLYGLNLNLAYIVNDLI